MDDIEVVRDEGRFVMISRGQTIGMLEYTDRGGAVEVYRVRVSQDHVGLGLADRLTRAALRDLRTHNEQLVPRSSYVRGYVLQHPEFQDLLTSDARLSLGL